MYATVQKGVKKLGASMQQWREWYVAPIARVVLETKHHSLKDFFKL